MSFPNRIKFKIFKKNANAKIFMASTVNIYIPVSFYVPDKITIHVCIDNDFIQLIDSNSNCFRLNYSSKNFQYHPRHIACQVQRLAMIFLTRLPRIVALLPQNIVGNRKFFPPSRESLLLEIFGNV